ncbi:hypothetical protein BYT27DRAFT_6674509 [Phlegmacium glaucopus]|nr:hypothetical protein BYT27DRAFT_6674509 [Phlegmacium glaucopus]
MLSFDLRHFRTNFRALFTAQFASSVASFRALMRPLLSIGSEDMEFWRWRHPFCFREISQDLLSSGTVQLLLRTSFVIVPLLIPFCTSHISPIFISFFVIQHSFHIYSSSSFWSHHLFLFASSSSLSIVIISHVGIIWTYLSQIFAIFLHQGVVLGCFPLVYHVITMHWPFSVRFSWLSHTPLIIAMHQSWSFVSLILPPPSPFSFTHWGVRRTV